MPNRTRIAVIVLAAILALACLVPLTVDAFRAAHRPPVVITMPPGASNPPLPYASTSLAALTGDSPPKDGRRGGGDGDAGQAVDALAPATPALPLPSSASGPIYIHVAGAVRHPGVYQLAEGSRVFNAVHAAGGALPGSDPDAINLAERLDDGEKVTLPLKGQADAAESDDPDGGGVTGGPSLDAASAGPVLKSSSGGSSAPPSKRRGRRGRASKSGGTSGDGSGHVGKITQGKIHINSASAADFERLPGIGPALAARIVAGRHALGGFQNVTDLRYIRGLGPGKYQAIAPYVTL